MGTKSELRKHVKDVITEELAGAISEDEMVSLEHSIVNRVSDEFSFDDDEGEGEEDEGDGA